MSSNKIQDTFAEAYLAGAKAELFILTLKIERREKENKADDDFDCERYAIKVLLDLAINSLDDQQKKDQLQAIVTHVLLDTTSYELNEVYQELTKFTVW